jgi:hypothetical protein
VISIGEIALLLYFAFNQLVGLIISRSFFESLLIALFGAGALKLLAILYKLFSSIAYSFENFTISGTWVASFDSYLSDKKNIEILQIKQNQELVFFYLEQYNNKKNKPIAFLGRGIFRGSEFSAIYYAAHKSFARNGVFTLRLVHDVQSHTLLSGEYAEFANTQEGNKIEIAKGSYRLRKINLPVAYALRLRLRMQTFRNFNEAVSTIDACA